MDHILCFVNGSLHLLKIVLFFFPLKIFIAVDLIFFFTKIVIDSEMGIFLSLTYFCSVLLGSIMYLSLK